MGGATALVEPKVFHPGVFARFSASHGAIATANRAAEGLCPVVHVAQLAEMQPGIAPADITPDPQRSEDLAKRSEAVGHAGEAVDHGWEARCDWRSVANQLFACSASNTLFFSIPSASAEE